MEKEVTGIPETLYPVIVNVECDSDKFPLRHFQLGMHCCSPRVDPVARAVLCSHVLLC